MPVPEYIRRLRRRVGHQLLLLPTVAGFIHDEAGRVLVVRGPSLGGWTLPGGIVEPGERPVEALLRECAEEAGVEVVPLAVLGVFGGPDGFRRIYHNKDKIECVEILFRARLRGGTAVARGDETEEARFLPAESLDDWAYPVSVKLLSEAARSSRTVMWHAGGFMLT